MTRYFAGECNVNEMKIIETWRNESPANTSFLRELERDQELINNYKVMKKVNVDRAWENVLGRVKTTTDEHIINEYESATGRKRSIVPVFMKIAASIVVLLGVYFSIHLIANNRLNARSDYVSTYSTDNNTVVNLPDGSKVYLNTEAEISYPKDFTQKLREVVLKGEAFFEVAHDSERPFIVNAGNARVKVLGTSFMVNKKSSNNVEVFVETGKVRLYEQNREMNGIYLDPGYIGKMDRKAAVKELNQDENIIAWKTKKIVFKDAELGHIFDVLSDVYNVKIVLENPDKLQCPTHTDTFDNQSLDDILKVLSANYMLDIRHADGKIVVKLNGCN